MDGLWVFLLVAAIFPRQTGEWLGYIAAGFTSTCKLPKVTVTQNHYYHDVEEA